MSPVLVIPLEVQCLAPLKVNWQHIWQTLSIAFQKGKRWCYLPDP